MSSSERAALNSAPRSMSASSQMAAITASQEKDETSMSSPVGSVKGKLDQIKQEDVGGMDIKMEIKQEEGEPASRMHMVSEGGKGIKKEMVDIKTEFKEEVEMKEEPQIKEEPRTPDSSADIKPTQPATMEMIQPSMDKKQKRCSK